MLPVYACAPVGLLVSMEILTSWQACPLEFPLPHMLLTIIIQGDFMMISFLILVGIFLIFGATFKTQIGTHLIYFKLGMELKKNGLVHTLCHSSRISLGMHKTME
jgi:hypothetical protein